MSKHVLLQEEDVIAFLRYRFEEALTKLLKQFENFMDNSVKVNLSLCELCTNIALLPGSNPSFFSFSADELVISAKFFCTLA